jgi:hypothetical protein
MENYEPVVIEVIRFENEDIITASNDTNGLIVPDDGE